MLDPLKGYMKGALRRAKDALVPDREMRAYERWIRERQIARREIYTHEPEPGLFSILTAVWDGSPVRYLRALANRIAEQNASGACEWVLLDNGCTKPEIRAYLHSLANLPWVKLVHGGTNLGITRGLRRCLEEARGRYVLPVDADDLLDRDALRIVATAAAEHNYPALLYTDEDKIIGRRRYQPYRKPDWDPVLLLNSAYIAHLGVVDREKALALGAYSDPAAEGSPDWDLFVRFLIAGHRAVHVPDIVYSWRVHAGSTADDDARKPYIVNSQRAVLQRFLDSRPEGKLFELEPSPLFAGGAHWHFRRKPSGRTPITIVRDPNTEQCAAACRQSEFVCLLGTGIEIQRDDWQWEALGITELHPDTAMIGGRIWNGRGELLEAGFNFDECGNCSNPHRGKPLTDPGYFGQLWKQRTVEAVSTNFAVMRSQFLQDLLEKSPSLENLDARAGLLAKQTNRRVVYSPFLGGLCRNDSASIS
ncbi:MAG TPA: glycosyltransferase [Bryobacteraceae bacterium]